MKKLWTLLLLLALFGLGIFLGQWIKSKATKKHTHRVGTINAPKNFPKDSVVEDWYRGAYHTYSSSSPKIYKGSKYQFKKKIEKSFNALNFKDNGYLSLRFFINPKGEIILYETIEMDLNLNLVKLDASLVNTLKQLSYDPNNWDPYIDDKHNYYLHLTYRIEDGKVTEIIP